MSFAKGLSGFIAGAGTGVFAVAVVSLYVPQFEGAKSPIEEAVLADSIKEDVESQIVEIEPKVIETPTIIEEPDEVEEDAIVIERSPAPEQETVKDDDKPVEVVESADPVLETEANETAEIVESEVDMIPKEKDESKKVETEIAPELPKVEVARIEPEPEIKESLDVPDESVIKANEDEAPEIGLIAEPAEPIEKSKKFKLPTIETESPVEVDDAVENVKPSEEENEISIGEKSKSKLPKITVNDPQPDEGSSVDTPLVTSALELNATEFEGSDKPLMGVILRDIGDKGLAVEQLKKLNAPITIAILSDAPDASERALKYHAAGFEVIAMASDDRNNPLNTAINSNQTLDAINIAFTNVPNAIGMLDSTQANIQKNGRNSKAIVANFAETGHGLITYAKGLNSIDREATSAGIRTGKIQRNLDENSENKALIGRYLDRVSLDAGRDGATIILGTTAKDTVAAIASWVLSSKGQSVTLAPASAVLLTNKYPC